MSGAKIGTFVVLAAVCSAPLTAGASFTVGFSAVKDADISTLDGAMCANNRGDATEMSIGVQCVKACDTRRALLHFDLSIIPRGATIISALLKLRVASAVISNTNPPFQGEIRRLTQPFWVQSEVIWEVYGCPNGDATQFPWCAAGGDFDSQALVAWTPGVDAEIRVLAQDALDQRSGQLHLLLKRGNETQGMDNTYIVAVNTKEATDPSFRPRLVVQYDPPPAPTPTPAWVTFRDDTSQRLNVASCTELSPPRPLAEEDRMEKDIATGDFDNDGDEDIIVVRKEPFSVAGAKKDLLLLNENGVLVDRSDQLPLVSGSPVTTDARDVFVGDFDGDSWPDLAIATTCNTPPRFYRNKQTPPGGTWQGFEDKTGATPTTPGGWRPSNGPYEGYSVPGKRFCAVWGGDVDGDGDIDLYFSNYTGGTGGAGACVEPGGSGGVSNRDVLLINKINGADATGRFVDETMTRLDYAGNPAPADGELANVGFGTAVEIRDLPNGAPPPTPSFSDIVKVTTLFPTDPFQIGVFILRNKGQGTFEWQHPRDTVLQLPTETDGPYMVTAGKLDGDSILDMYVVRDGRDDVYHGTGNPPTYSSTRTDIARTNRIGGNVKMVDFANPANPNHVVDAIGVASADVDFNDSCNVCEKPNRGTCPPPLTICCTITGEACLDASGNPDQSKCPIVNTGVPAFALLKNDRLGNVSDPWAGADQAFHLKNHDFAFVDVNADGCPDLFMALCGGYKLFIEQHGTTNCP